MVRSLGGCAKLRILSRSFARGGLKHSAKNSVLSHLDSGHPLHNHAALRDNTGWTSVKKWYEPDL